MSQMVTLSQLTNNYFVNKISYTQSNKTIYTESIYNNYFSVKKISINSFYSNSYFTKYVKAF